jgi:biopolymer transport protein ExbB
MTRPARIRFILPFMALAAGTLLATTPALAQITPVRELPIWPLFWQSFDLFTVLLLIGSIAAVAIMTQCILEIRERKLLSRRSIPHIDELIRTEDWRELRGFVAKDASFPARVLHSTLSRSEGRMPTREALRETAEMAASEECARWFRRIEPLNIIGNIGPLVGLAGTVWGMILAFATLALSGGLKAEAGDLSGGISKALFHTLLGLCLAIPCMLAFGLFRSKVDRICTRGMVIAAAMVERLPAREPAAPTVTLTTIAQPAPLGPGAAPSSPAAHGTASTPTSTPIGTPAAHQGPPPAPVVFTFPHLKS